MRHSALDMGNRTAHMLQEQAPYHLGRSSGIYQARFILIFVAIFMEPNFKFSRLDDKAISYECL